ncbi:MULTISPECIES: hypothetical protein [unclassified Corynebacterium]|uniref:hypothetical protein n=1 Tax=unclassified Corynebacterium TaxID=2624378 RepID=UPI0008A53887|nr:MULTISPECIES: hypothetical protein [unclassified Corynebacterium]MDK8364303.1 hypothetical protein [Corynebacterium sp. UMB10119B]OFT29306.1 hypothetical protein HMPREF3170_06875 [Corynebacterium sp. HMSC08D02]
MKKIAAAALAATITVGALAPTAGAQITNQGFVFPVTNTMVGGTCLIKGVPGSPAPYTPDQAAAQIPIFAEDASKTDNGQSTSPRELRAKFFAGVLSGNEAAINEYSVGLAEYVRALEACAAKKDYKSDAVITQSSKMTPSERAAAFWTPLAVSIVALLGTVALPALKPMLPANIAAMLP